MVFFVLTYHKGYQTRHKLRSDISIRAARSGRAGGLVSVALVTVLAIGARGGTPRQPEKPASLEQAGHAGVRRGG